MTAKIQTNLPQPISSPQLCQEGENPIPCPSIYHQMWRQFCRNRLARFSLVIVALLYLMAAFADFLSPYALGERHRGYVMAPPTKVYLRDEQGRWQRPFVYRTEPGYMDRQTFKRVYAEDRSQRYPIRFFVTGAPYKLLGLIPTQIHLFGTGDPDVPIFLMGADNFGRDMLTRCLYGSRISLSVGLVGVLLTIIFGSILGVASGYYGGTVDMLLQRIVEILQAIPTFPLWLALAAIVPPTWSSVATYFMITVILSLINWTGLARTLRGMTLRMRRSDLVRAAQCIGASDWRIIIHHIMPYNISYIVVRATLSIPGTIIGETSLSFLGLGIRPPMVSWGVLLSQAQNITNVAFYPWLLWPALFVIVAVLAFNFIGDGVRDAVDPYNNT